LALVTLGGLIYLFITQVLPMFAELMAALPEIQQKMMTFADFLSSRLGVSFDAGMMPNVTKIATNVGASAFGIATAIGMIFVYMLFMFVEQSTFNKKFAALFPNKSRSKKMRFILGSIDENMKKYLFMKTLISGVTGVLSFFWLQAIGLQFAGVWAFIVFVTSYIPTIGAIVAGRLPVFYLLVITDKLHQPLLADFIFAGHNGQSASAIAGRRRINRITDFVRQHYRTEINRQNIKPVNVGDFNQPGVLGNAVGDCGNVFQRAVIGGDVYHHGPV